MKSALITGITGQDGSYLAELLLEKGYFVVSDFCRQVAEIEAGKRNPVMLVGNLSAFRDFTDVRDIARAYALLAEKGRSVETYNVGSGKAVQISAILDKIVARSRKRIGCALTSQGCALLTFPESRRMWAKSCVRQAGSLNEA